MSERLILRGSQVRYLPIFEDSTQCVFFKPSQSFCVFLPLSKPFHNHLSQRHRFYHSLFLHRSRQKWRGAAQRLLPALLLPLRRSSCYPCQLEAKIDSWAWQLACVANDRASQRSFSILHAPWPCCKSGYRPVPQATVCLSHPRRSSRFPLTEQALRFHLFFINACFYTLHILT